MNSFRVSLNMDPNSQEFLVILQYKKRRDGIDNLLAGVSFDFAYIPYVAEPL